MSENLWNSSAAVFVLFFSVLRLLSTFSLVNNFLSYAKQMHKVAAASLFVLLCFVFIKTSLCAQKLVLVLCCDQEDKVPKLPFKSRILLNL